MGRLKWFRTVLTVLNIEGCDIWSKWFLFYGPMASKAFFCSNLDTMNSSDSCDVSIVRCFYALPAFAVEMFFSSWAISQRKSLPYANRWTDVFLGPIIHSRPRLHRLSHTLLYWIIFTGIPSDGISVITLVHNLNSSNLFLTCMWCESLNGMCISSIYTFLPTLLSKE